MKTYQCEECGRNKHASTGWYLVLNTDDFVLRQWALTDPDSPTVKAHVCSLTCATNALIKWGKENK